MISMFLDFDARSSVNDLTADERSLYIALMQLANRGGWPKVISKPVSELAGLSGMSTKAFYTAKNKLKQKGFIDTKEGRGNQSCKYWFVFPYDTQTGIQSGMQTGGQKGSQSDNIYIKDKKRKDKKDDDNNNVPVGTGFGELLTEDEINTGRQKEVDLDALYGFFQSCDPGVSSDYDRTRLRVLLDEGYTRAEIHSAIKQSADNKAVKWPYITKVLTNKRGEKSEFLRPAAGHKQQGQRGHQSGPTSEWGDLDTIDL